MTNEQAAADALSLLEPLIQQAEREGKLLESTYQNIVFTPAELRRANAEGKFRWGPVNWRLVTKQEYLAGFDASVQNAIAARDAAYKRFA